jgi:hypothetical protein
MTATDEPCPAEQAWLRGQGTIPAVRARFGAIERGF